MVRDVAKLFKVAEKTVYRWIKDDGIPAYRVGEQYRFHRAEVLEWATARKIGASVDVFREQAAAEGDQAPVLSEALSAGGIVHRLGGGDMAAILQAAVAAMRLPEEVNREQLLKVLWARESLASTAIGDGIAIPHVRSPIVLHVSRPTITLCFLEQPVEFGALDGQPVYCLFTLVSPTVRSHLQLISKLAYALRDPGFHAVIAKRGQRDEILSELCRLEARMARSKTTSFPNE
jgi:PTS system nitrogen regulatory IIA component